MERVNGGLISGNGYVPLLQEYGLRYALMVDGRTLPGVAVNPPDEWLAGPGYMGRQAHENDGNFYYWGPYRYEGLYTDLKARSADAGGIFAKGPAHPGSGGVLRRI